MSAVAVVAAAALTLAACGDDSGGGSGGGGKVTIGIKFDQPGIGLKQGEKYSGLDVDVAKYVAKELGYKEGDITWKAAPSKQREQLIKSGQVKMVVASYSITDERKKEVSFAGPYFIAQQALLVKKDSGITDLQGLQGKKLCSVSGSTSATKLKAKVPGVNLQEFDTYSKCAEVLASGRIDAMTTDDTILSGYANQAAYKGKLQVVPGVGGDEIYGIGIKKGDTATCKKINDALKKMVQDGTWKKAVETNLGSEYKIDSSKNPPQPAACS
ncbi:glutamate ABC transporter substrate-binding protein [Luteipulveratus flavus]|uniref:Glutamate ABC transporter substrate-binding protein n=2 Tax=Luteipulveratus flavus TaxID=3031728 RepID=A0ABT6C3G9_9MICO|nr:glutamate ABC transporter substrate-binding protein [Luteipulveratus sp. YIM 133296]MDF8263407.1 glutamate ABC transporter substrate-binding protein [Luteipulveratus sp. YIM 133296]